MIPATMAVVLAEMSSAGEVIKELLGASPDAVLIVLGFFLILLSVVGFIPMPKRADKIEPAWRVVGILLGLFSLSGGLYLHAAYHQLNAAAQSQGSPSAAAPENPAADKSSAAAIQAQSSKGSTKGINHAPTQSVDAFPPCNKFTILHAADVAHFEGLAGHKALSVSDSNCSGGWDSGRLNIEDARKLSLQQCAARGLHDGDPTRCEVVMVDGEKIKDF